jgi:hypothetical protein
LDQLEIVHTGGSLLGNRRDGYPPVGRTACKRTSRARAEYRQSLSSYLIPFFIRRLRVIMVKIQYAANSNSI